MTDVSSRRAYLTDLSVEQWAILERALPPAPGGGRKRTVNLREIVNAILYRLRTGYSSEMLPHDFPPNSTEARGERGYDAGRQGRPPTNPGGRRLCRGSNTRTLTTSSGRYTVFGALADKARLGLLIAVVITAASVQDRDGAQRVFQEARGETRLELIWADGGYAGKLIETTRETFGWKLEIVKRSDDVKGFKMLPHRWIVERTFGWLGRSRLFCREHEATINSSRADIHLAMSHIMLRHLTRPTKTQHQDEHLLDHIA